MFIYYAAHLARDGMNQNVRINKFKNKENHKHSFSAHDVHENCLFVYRKSARQTRNRLGRHREGLQVHCHSNWSLLGFIFHRMIRFVMPKCDLFCLVIHEPFFNGTRINDFRAIISLRDCVEPRFLLLATHGPLARDVANMYNVFVFFLDFPKVIDSIGSDFDNIRKLRRCVLVYWFYLEKMARK